MVEDILSVGIDIGTSTTQLVFSRIKIENTASFTSVPRISIIDKEVIYRSDIYFTPLLSQTEINGPELRDIVCGEYGKAGISPEDISTGVAIITGETARKKNASQVLETLSSLAGDFVVTTAGPDLEGIIAGKGAGAQLISRNTGKTVANLDIGGGTTNIAVFRDGEVIDTCCLDIGGRLIRLSEELKVQYIAPKLSKLSKELGISIEQDMEIAVKQLRVITDRMAEILGEVLGLADKSTELGNMLTTRDLKRNYKLDCISFSGGVADYIYKSTDSNVFKFGDIGILLGESIRNSHIFRSCEIAVPLETIRATVIGAGTHTVDISGSTINYTKDIFPVKNIPILKLSEVDEAGDYDRIAEGVKEKLRWFCHGEEEQQIALAIKGVKNPSFRQVCKIAQEVLKGMEDMLKTKLPIIVIIENDMAKVLGQTLYRHLNYGREVICIDDISVENGDYIDIGRPLAGGRVVPVIIKTLVFNS